MKGKRITIIISIAVVISLMLTSCLIFFSQNKKLEKQSIKTETTQEMKEDGLENAQQNDSSIIIDNKQSNNVTDKTATDSGKEKELPIDVDKSSSNQQQSPSATDVATVSSKTTSSQDNNTTIELPVIPVQ